MLSYNFLHHVMLKPISFFQSKLKTDFIQRKCRGKMQVDLILQPIEIYSIKSVLLSTNGFKGHTRKYKLKDFHTVKSLRGLYRKPGACICWHDHLVGK